MKINASVLSYELQCELELLRQQDQRRMQEVERTLQELERDGREMAAQRLCGLATQQHKTATSSQHVQTDGAQTGSAQQHQQVHTFCLWQKCI